MATRASHTCRLTAVGLAALLIAGPLALPSHAQEPVRGISLFPGPETRGVVPKAEVPPLPESAYVAAAFLASLATFPHRVTWCLLGEGLGFFVGSVLRVPVWIATAGDRLGSSEGLDRLGTAMVETGCGDSLVVTSGDLKRWQPQEERATAPNLQTR